MQEVTVFRIPTSAPDDVSGLQRLLADGTVAATDIVCILGKTEGNGCVNDFTRGFATRAYQELLANELGSADAVAEQVALIMSGGTEGVLSPHVTVFARTTAPAAGGDPTAEPRLAVGVAHTPPISAESLGRTAQAQAVADAVHAARLQAELTTEDVHFVQVKCPLLTADRIAEAAARGAAVVTTDTYKSMGFSRGASALGIAAALGEVDAAAITDQAVCRDWQLYSAVASTSAGVELSNCEVMVLGNSAAAAGNLTIGHAVMADAIDADAVYAALASAGLEATPPLDAAARERVVAVLAKAEASSNGQVRGRRHTMLEDSDINHTRHARAAVGAVVASVAGDPMVYVSGGAEHQGPDGGGPVAAIVRAGE